MLTARTLIGMSGCPDCGFAGLKAGSVDFVMH